MVELPSKSRGFPLNEEFSAPFEVGDEVECTTFGLVPERPSISYRGFTTHRLSTQTVKSCPKLSLLRQSKDRKKNSILRGEITLCRRLSRCVAKVEKLPR
jgi:hypothetical protein